MTVSLLDALHQRLRLGWMLAAAVPIAAVGGFVVGPLVSREAGLALLLVAVLAEVVSPAVIYTVGFAARRLRPAAPVPAPSLPLGYVAVALHVVALVVLAFAGFQLAESTRDGSMAGLGLLVGSFFVAGLSLVPWLAAVITGGVFATRGLRELEA
jgi:hypothetical protein